MHRISCAADWHDTFVLANRTPLLWCHHCQHSLTFLHATLPVPQSGCNTLSAALCTHAGHLAFVFGTYHGCNCFRRAEETRKERKGRKRNLALLSFGEQAEEEEQDLAARGTAAKIRYGHGMAWHKAYLLMVSTAFSLSCIGRKQEK